MNLKKTIFIIICFSAFAKGFAQQEAAYVRAEEEKWLPKHFIRDIFQDSKGIMWIGTNAGLYKYNLHTLENINLTKKRRRNF